MSSTLLNPYVVGGAISDSAGQGFYGREEVFEFVRAGLQVTRRPPILLYGQRRIGKSSILRQLPRHLPADYRCIYYDLQGKAELTLDQVLYGLGRAIADGLSISRPDREQATGDSFLAFLEQSIMILGGKAERLVLLFDEFDVVDQHFASAEAAATRFIPYLADLVSAQPRVGYVLVVGRKTEELSDGFFSALLKDSIQMRIGRLSKDQTARLVRESAQDSLKVTDQALERLYTITSGHPYCSQVLCHTVWNRAMKSNPSLEVGAAQVDDAIDPATELGTNGLNWIYDGLEKPAHRLVLASLASLAGPRAMGSADLSELDRALLGLHLRLPESEIRLATRELESWEVTVRGDGRGIRFAVPLIGYWIQKNRPLDQLEQETRLVSPRATKFYELAVGSSARADYDSAINEYQNALAENSVYVEAQLGLADSYRARKKSGDLERAIEAYERVLDLDPTSPRTALLECLGQSLEAAKTDVQKIRKRFARIQELDPQGPFGERARRTVGMMADIRLKYGRRTYSQEAIELYDLLGDASGAALAREKFRLSDRITNWTLPFMFLFAILALNATAALKFPLPPIYLIGFADLAATFFTVFATCETDGKVKLRRLNLPGLFGGFVAGFAILQYLHSPVWARILAFVFSLIAGIAADPGSDRPAELMAPQQADSKSLRETLAGVLDRLAKKMRLPPGKSS
jgi:hypothetical protein